MNIITLWKKLKDICLRFLDNRVFTGFVLSLIFVLIAFLAIYIRIQTIPALGKDLFLGTDAYRYAKRANMILQEGSLPSRDSTAWLPEGQDLTSIRAPFSLEYILSYAYRFISIFNPKITLHTVAIYYPVVVYIACLVLLFLLCTKLFDVPQGLLALILLSVCPGTLDRTMAGFADRDAWTLFLALLSYVLYIFSFYHPNLKGKVLAFCSGIVMGIVGLVWEGSGIFIAVVIIFNIIKWLLKKWNRKDFELYVYWVIPVVSILLVVTNGYRRNLSSGYSALAVLFPLGFLLLLSCQYIFVRLHRSRAALKRFYHFAIIIGVGIIIGVPGFIFRRNIWSTGYDIFDNFFHTFGLSRHFLTVQELQLSTAITWSRALSIVFFLFVAGSVLIIWRICNSFSLNPWLVGGSFQILVGSVLYVQLPLSRTTYLGSTFANALYSGAILLLLSVLVVISIQKRLKKRKSNSWLEPREQSLLFLLVWCLLMLCLTRASNRFMIFFAPAAVLISAFFIFEFYRWIIRTQDFQAFLFFVLIMLLWQLVALNKIESLFVAISLTFILSVLSFFRLFRRMDLQKTGKKVIRGISGLLLIGGLTAFFSIPNEMVGTGWAYLMTQKAQKVQPVLEKEWKNALHWAKSNLPENTVMVAWWTYGSQINWLSGKATVVDEYTVSEYRIHLLARHFFCGQSFEETLQILRTYGVTHVAISKWELRLQDLISFVGSDSEYDRLNPIINLGEIKRTYTDEKLIVKLNPQVKPVYGANYEFDLFRNLLKQKQAVEYATIEFTIEGGETITGGEVQFKNCEKPYPVKVWYKGKIIESKKDSVSGLLYLRGCYGGGWTGVFLPESLANSTAVRLFLLGEGKEYFEPVYPVDSEYSSVKIWRVKYPNDILPKDEYLALKFPKGELYSSWKLRGGKKE